MERGAPLYLKKTTKLNTCNDRRLVTISPYLETQRTVHNITVFLRLEERDQLGQESPPPPDDSVAAMRKWEDTLTLEIPRLTTTAIIPGFKDVMTWHYNMLVRDAGILLDSDEL